MKSYSPYENVDGRGVPADPGDHQPERHPGAATSSRPSGSPGCARRAPAGRFLLKTEMGAGHGGPSGRYDAWRDEAFTLAWMLDTAKVTQ